jgi:outer membrane protein OmpA-like peptidoglycan-associated protein
MRLGYNISHRWEIELGYSYDSNNSDRTLFRRSIAYDQVDVGAVVNFNTGEAKRDTRGRWFSWDRWIPYITAGVGYFSADDDLTGTRSSNTFFIGGGTRIMATEYVGFRFDLRGESSLDDADFGGSFFNPEASIGIDFILGGATPRDSDSDGVIDGVDKCPGTPIGCWVDEKGCPRDSDGDGVCDGLDRCPNTPAGCPVDEHGCPMDEDGDGVCDGLDNCPGTPAGCWVDDKGCPRDSDKDGVCDGVDKCADTPEGCKVDAQGCPLDGDGDGVCDGIDQCPDTPRGVRVDARGCSIEISKLVLSSVYFEFNKSDIRSFYKVVLDEVATSLLAADHRTVEIELRGHTDAISSVDYNYRLGQARADAVKEHLVAKGVAPGRLLTKSYSELEPAAPNTKDDGSDNPDGRALNRRVEMVPTAGATGGQVDVKVLVRDVMFKKGSSDLSDEGRKYLDDLAAAFSAPELASIKLTITGHASKADASLAQQRADAVSSYLGGKGIAADRLVVAGGGSAGDKVVVGATR